MPGGIINPKGRRKLNETARDLMPSHKSPSDVQLGLIKKEKAPYQKPFLTISSKSDVVAIKKEIRRVAFSLNKKKSTILTLLKDLFSFSAVESENIYFQAMINTRTKPEKSKVRIERLQEVKNKLLVKKRER